MKLTKITNLNLHAKNVAFAILLVILSAAAIVAIYPLLAKVFFANPIVALAVLSLVLNVVQLLEAAVKEARWRLEEQCLYELLTED